MQIAISHNKQTYNPNIFSSIRYSFSNGAKKKPYWFRSDFEIEELKETLHILVSAAGVGLRAMRDGLFETRIHDMVYVIYFVHIVCMCRIFGVYNIIIYVYKRDLKICQWVAPRSVGGLVHSHTCIY